MIISNRVLFTLLMIIAALASLMRGEKYTHDLREPLEENLSEEQQV